MIGGPFRSEGQSYCLGVGPTLWKSLLLWAWTPLVLWGPIRSGFGLLSLSRIATGRPCSRFDFPGEGCPDRGGVGFSLPEGSVVRIAVFAYKIAMYRVWEPPNLSIVVEAVEYSQVEAVRRIANLLILSRTCFRNPIHRDSVREMDSLACASRFDRHRAGTFLRTS